MVITAKSNKHKGAISNEQYNSRSPLLSMGFEFSLKYGVTKASIALDEADRQFMSVEPSGTESAGTVPYQSC